MQGVVADARLQGGRGEGENLHDGFNLSILTRLDLDAAGLSSVNWATGFRPDFSWVELPVFDAEDRPQSDRGVTCIAWPYFAGMRWQPPETSTLIGGLGAEADRIATRIAGQLAAASGDRVRADRQKRQALCGARLPQVLTHGQCAPCEVSDRPCSPSATTARR